MQSVRLEMQEQVPKQLIEAGRIAANVRKGVRCWANPRDTLLSICSKVEDEIRRLGGAPAFPCNVCLNEVAAHYTSPPGDKTIVKEGDVLKIDIGVHIDGYIADTATTLSFNTEYDGMVRAVEDALIEAVKLVRDGVKVGEIGRAISTVAAKRGYQPITNLSGHMIGPYMIHAGISIPNIWVPGTSALKAGEVYAIEPFLTSLSGGGEVVNGKSRTIFSLASRKKTGDKTLDEFSEQVWKRVKTLPFALRHFVDLAPPDVLESIVKRLEQRKALRSYPMLIESKGKYVMQAEHTVIPTVKGLIVTTA